MGEDKPEPKDWLGKSVEDGIAHNLGVDTHVSGAIRDAPNAR